MESLKIGVHIRIDEDMHGEIKEIAKKEHRSISQQVRHLVELGIKSNKPTKPAA
jgi:hypothetical protein